MSEVSRAVPHCTQLLAAPLYAMQLGTSRLQSDPLQGQNTACLGRTHLQTRFYASLDV